MARKTKDETVAVPRFLAGCRSVRDGLNLQRERIDHGVKAAPSIGVGSEAVKNLTYVPEADLWYYVYELGRLRDLTTAVAGWFREPALEQAKDALDAAIPHLREARNRWTHVIDDEYLDMVVSLGILVRLKPGSAEVLIDPRGYHHDSAIACLTTVEQFLRAKLNRQIADDPPLPLDQQIASRRV
ncbi:MAG: hypothetical protein JWN84_1135 [Nocardioides sp.]|nr:hypothetical protein [Nocardioides sp.]